MSKTLIPQNPKIDNCIEKVKAKINTHPYFTKYTNLQDYINCYIGEILNLNNKVTFNSGKSAYLEVPQRLSFFEKFLCKAELTDLMKEIAQEAEQNDEMALIVINAYRRGIGFDCDYKKAFDLCETLAEKSDDSAAKHLLATFYKKGIGVDENKTLAESYYFLSAISGNSLSQYELDDLHGEIPAQESSLRSSDDRLKLAYCYMNGIHGAPPERMEKTVFMSALAITESKRMLTLAAAYDDNIYFDSTQAALLQARAARHSNNLELAPNFDINPYHSNTPLTKNQIFEVIDAIAMMPKNKVAENTIYGVIKESAKNLSSQDLDSIREKISALAADHGVDLSKSRLFKQLFEKSPNTAIASSAPVKKPFCNSPDTLKK